MKTRLLAGVCMLALATTGTAGPAATTRGTALPLAPASLPRLLATFVHSDPARSQAVVAAGNNTSQIVHVGQALAAGYSVQAIEPRRLVLAQGTQRYALPLLGQPRAATPGIARTPAATGNRAASVQQRNTNSGVQFSADSSASLRNVCANSGMMAGLDEAQRAELAATGICPAP